MSTNPLNRDDFHHKNKMFRLSCPSAGARRVCLWEYDSEITRSLGILVPKRAHLTHDCGHMDYRFLLCGGSQDEVGMRLVSRSWTGVAQK